MKSFVLLLASSLLVSCAAAAAGAPGKKSSGTEVIQFKNGDRLTGTFERYTGGKLKFKTKTVGEVSISPGDVASFTSVSPVVVVFNQGNVKKGTLSLDQSGHMSLRQGGHAQQPFSKKDVLGIFPVPVYKASAPDRRDRPWLFWHGKGSLGYTVEHGDQSADTLALAFSAIRMQPPLPGMDARFRTNFSLNALEANTSDIQGARTRTNSADVTARQDFFLHHNPHNFLFVLGQIDHIEAQSLALRQTYGGGFGRDVVRSSNTTFSLLGGLTYVHERFFSQPGDIKSEALAGEKLSLHLWRIGLDHQLSFYPGLTNAGQYRFDTNTTVSSPITKELSFQVGFTDHFLSNPLPGHKSSDVIYTTGVGLNF